MIVGVGIDVVPVERFAAIPGAHAGAWPSGCSPRPSGRAGRARRRSAESLAARFAAKEALAKALGAGGGMAWTDAEVVLDDVGRPSLTVRGTVRRGPTRSA